MAAIVSEVQPEQEIRGLSEQEAQRRRARGQGNNIKLRTSRTYWDIVRSNVFNLINVILFTVGAIMILIGRVGDAVTSVGLIALNVVIGLYQEVRAKRQLDHIALLTRPRVVIRRDGVEREVDPAEIVLGDVIILHAGDQIVVDGQVLSGSAGVDESLLTGEADIISKGPGDQLLSGSFCVTGQLIFEATAVGEDAFANKLTASARQFQTNLTPLQREVNLILRLLMLLATFLGFMILVATIVSAVPFMRQVQMAAVIVGLVPNGLFLMVILAYAMGALRIVQRGALVQQSNAVESLSNVTVLCTDKTGTLTANRIVYKDVYPVSGTVEELKRILGDFASSASASNKTNDALRDGLGGKVRRTLDEVPFSSALKWSALAFDDEAIQGVYVLGAVEMLESQIIDMTDAAREQIATWSDEGMRVLVFAHNTEARTLHDAAGNPALPPLRLLGVICLGDELRPHLKETLSSFAEAGIEVKVISGDNPQTVAALARQAGFAGDLSYVSGVDLAQMTEAEFMNAAIKSTVFGRITPEQKEALVDALRFHGHYVAMIGDGVNDVLSLKKADMGIAMESGSAATRGVADMILLQDSFAALPQAFSEGQRIVNGMRDILRLFMVRVLYGALLIIAVSVTGLGFPFIPKHNALLVGLTVGVPTLMLAIWARPGPLPQRSMLREIAHFVVPAALSITVFGLLVYLGAFITGLFGALETPITPESIAQFESYAGITYGIATNDAYLVEVSSLVAQTVLTTFLTFAGLVLVVFVEPPTRWLAGGDEFSGDWRPTIVALLMLAAYGVIVTVEPLRHFFELLPLPPSVYLVLALITLLWAMVLRLAWRGHWLQRFLGYDFRTGIEGVRSTQA